MGHDRSLSPTISDIVPRAPSPRARHSGDEVRDATRGRRASDRSNDEGDARGPVVTVDDARETMREGDDDERMPMMRDDRASG
tara:strand:+ start:165 stop:413 length:249 start_codon:yes stop_codon:yes gene_type:complete